MTSSFPSAEVMHLRFSLNLGRERNGAELECQAKNEASDLVNVGPTMKTIHVQVQYPPEVKQIYQLVI